MKVRITEVLRVRAEVNRENDEKLAEAATRGQQGFEGYGQTLLVRAFLDKVINDCTAEVEIPTELEHLFQ
jgi:hypothetical protein